MDKKSITIFSVVIVVLIGVIVFLSIAGDYQQLSAGRNEPTEPAPVETILELSFYQPGDLDWLSYFSNAPVTPEDIFMDGLIRFSDAKISGGSILYDIRADMVVHTRVRNSPEGPGYLTSLGFDIPESRNGENAYFQIGSQPGSPYIIEAVIIEDTYGNGKAGQIKTQGSAILNRGQWVDMIFYIPKHGTSMYFFIADADNDTDIVYTSVSFTEDWLTEAWEFGVESVFDFGVENQFVDVDSITVAYGPIKSYLYHNIPAYLVHQERMDEFFTLPPSDLPELEVTRRN